MGIIDQTNNSIQEKTNNSEDPIKKNYRTQGKVNEKGKLIKGFVNDASKKKFIASIPAKHEQVIFKVNSQKEHGFGQGSSRFNNQSWIKYNPDTTDRIPGVGSYSRSQSSINDTTRNYNNNNNTTYINNSNNNSTILNASVLQNQSLLSENYYTNTRKVPKQDFTDRQFGKFQARNIGGPGPGSYDNVQGNFNQLEKRTTNSKGSAPFFKNKLPKPSIEQNPAPTDYNVIKKGNQISPCYSSFISGSNKCNYINTNNHPGIGEYNVQKGIQDKKLYPHVGFSKNFQPSVKDNQQAKNIQNIREILKDHKYSSLNNITPIYEESKPVPGPGFYDLTNEPDIKPLYKENSLSPGFMQGKKDRFGIDYNPTPRSQIVYNALLPGPGAYDVNKYGLDDYKAKKSLVGISCFLSESKREPYGDYDKKMGPNFKNVLTKSHSQKRSFHLNIDQKWV